MTGEVLGSGNAALASQSFTLAMSPLTYLAGGSGPASTLAVHVDGVQWQEVPNFYGQSPSARVFVVSRSADQTVTTVTFGDGVSGARLTSGTGNITATYRYGSGAASPPAERLTTISQPQPNLASIQNPVAVSGGADPQAPEDVRADAPASVSTFGRAISVADYEVIAGGPRRRPHRGLLDVRPGGAAPDRDHLRGRRPVSRCGGERRAGRRGRPRPVAVLAANPIELSLSCTLVVAADGQVPAVAAAAAAAVSDSAGGLFCSGRMGIGQRLYRSAVGAALMVPGVVAVHDLAVTWAGQVLGEFFDPGEGSFFDLPPGNVTIGGSSPVTDVNDGYDTYYAERLWQLLPAVYRTADTDSLGAPGPLRELLNRTGVQVAVVRRSMDRLWGDQSIETCDDWVIPYIGDLLGANLVSDLDARAQRLDVAKTIHYRRRKGTVQILEELALDVTGWTAHVVEGFRRLGRTRHGLDPAVGPAAFPQASAADVDLVPQLLQTEGLTGLLTGGWRANSRTCGPRTARAREHGLRRGLPRGRLPGLPRSRRPLRDPQAPGVRVAADQLPGPGRDAGRRGRVPWPVRVRPDRPGNPLFLRPPDPFRRVRRVVGPGPRVAGTGPADELPRGRDYRSRDVRACPPPYPGADVPPRYGLGGGWQLTSIWPEIGRLRRSLPSPARAAHG